MILKLETLRINRLFQWGKLMSLRSWIGSSFLTVKGWVQLNYLKIKHSFYIFPKHLPDSAPQDIGVIGGTFIEGGSPDKPNLKEYDSMIDEANTFFGLNTSSLP